MYTVCAFSERDSFSLMKYDYCRSRLKLEPSQTVYLAIAGKNILNLSLTMIEIHSKYKDEDGFLYVSYASEEMFG